MSAERLTGARTDAAPSPAPSPWADRTSRLGFAVAAATSVVVTVVWLGVQGGPIWDDPYIFFRVARNLAQGHGWTFNPGADPVNATTSVTHTLALVPGQWLGLSAPTVATVVWAVCLPAGAILLGYLVADAGFVVGGSLVSLATVILPSFTVQRGMETALLVLVVAGVLFCARRDHPVGLGVAVGLLVLTRPDAVVLVLGLLATDLLLPRAAASPLLRAPRTVALGALGVVTPWLLYAWVTFGRFVPTTLAAKRAQLDSGSWESFAHAFFHRPLAFESSALVDVMLVLAVLGVVTAVRCPAVRGVMGPLLVTAGLQIVVFAWITPVPMYPWYPSLIVLALVVAAAVGLEAVGRVLVAHVSALAAWGTAGLVAVALVAYGFGRLSTEPTPLRASMADAGRWISRNTPDDATVAAQEIGIVGWYSNRTIIDYLGLLDPDRHDEVARRDFVSWLPATQPDYWVVSAPLSIAFVDARPRTNPAIMVAFEPVVVKGDALVLHRTARIPARAAAKP